MRAKFWRCAAAGLGQPVPAGDPAHQRAGGGDAAAAGTGRRARRVPRTRRALLAALNVPQRLWPLAPSTFSGGEQRVNIARGFIVDYPILLLDEPTASLDSRNSAAVVQLIERASARRGDRRHFSR